MVRDRSHGAAIGPWRVQEKADRAVNLQPTQLRAKREEVVVLNPEHRIRSGEVQKRARHKRVDFAIRRIFVRSHLDEIGARVQCRP